MAYAVIRVRGQPDVNRDIEFTMGLLGLNRVNHCVIVPENASTKGMLQVVKDYCTWGEVNQDTLAAMIRARGKLIGDREITDDYLKDKSEFASVDDMAKAIIENNYRMKDVEEAKPIETNLSICSESSPTLMVRLACTMHWGLLNPWRP